MDNGRGEPAVRILADNDHSQGSIAPESRSPRLFLPAGVLVGIVGLFLITTGGTRDTTPTTTTHAPPIAKVSAEQLDLRTSTDIITTEEWTDVDFDDAVRVNDMVRSQSIYLAVGSTTDGPQVWTSGSGMSWAAVRRVEDPGGDADIIAVGRGSTRLVGLGSVDGVPAVWTAPVVSGWGYEGPLDASVQGSVVGLASGRSLLAVIRTEDGYRGWTSSNGTEWSDLGQLSGLDDADLNGVAADSSGAFLAYGLHSGCAMIYRSTDGIDWQPTLDPPDACGAVVDIAANDTRLVALGWISDNLARRRIAVWESTDGVDWRRLGLAEPVLAATNIGVEVVTSESLPDPVATMRIDGDVVSVTNGTTMATDIGKLTIDAVRDDGVTVSRGDSSLRLIAGRNTRLWSDLDPQQVAIEGNRIVISGSTTADGWASGVPTMWTSTDKGATWSMEFLPGNAMNYEVGTRAASVVVVGSGENGVSAWRTSWDSAQPAAAALELVETFLTSLAGYDSSGIVPALPKTASADDLEDFRVPSLGNQPVDWWDDDGELVESRIAGTMEYLDAIGTSLRYRDCHAAVGFGPTDGATVSCEATIGSSLLHMFGIDDGETRLRVVLSDGSIESVSLDPTLDAGMWSLLSDRLQDLGEPATLTFDAESAATHLAVARDYLESLLRPGETKVVETALGTIEWTWTEPLTLAEDAYPDSVVWTRFGFVVDVYTGAGQSMLFKSVDGESWQSIPTPDGIEGLWDLQPFADGLLANTWDGFESGAVFFDGSQWVTIDLPAGAGGGYFTAVAGPDSALVTTLQEDADDRPISLAMYVIDRDLAVHAVDNPPELSVQPVWGFGGVDIAASKNGFLATINNFATAETAIWASNDGKRWTLLTESLALDNSLGVWNLQHHRDRYFVVGQSSEMVCSGSGFDEVCSSINQMWTSPDGTQWQELRTTDGNAVSTSAIGEGPLGLIAFGDTFDGGNQPRELYVSGDGETWETVDGLALLNYGDQVWWAAGAPAVGNDTIVVLGTSYHEDQGFVTEVPFMIVGRLIDG